MGIDPFTPRYGLSQKSPKLPNFISQKAEKQIGPYESTAKVEWSQQKFLSKASKVKAMLQDSLFILGVKVLRNTSQLTQSLCLIVRRQN